MRTIGVAALVVFAWPGTAAAVTYGGGTPADSVERAQRQLTLVGLRTGASAHVWMKIAARCGVASGNVPVTVNRDGTFAVRKTVGGGIGGGVDRTARIRLAGRVGATSATGTVSARLTLRRHGRVVARCASGTRTWQARDPAPLGAPSAARPNVSYHGLTSQETSRPWPVALKVDATGRSVPAVAFEYRHRCRSGKAYHRDNITPGGAIAADGTYHLRERFTLHYAEGNERFRVDVDGRFYSDGGGGSLKVVSVLRSRRTGRVLDRCTTGAHTDFAVVP
jgi:hypothetical protein